MRITVDMDEVLADTFSAELNWLNREYGYQLTPEMTKGRDLMDLIPSEQFRHLLEVLQQGDIFANLPLMSGSQQVMQELVERYEVFIGTAAMEFPGSFTPKFHWLSTHFPFIDAEYIVFCGDKSILASDFLIDDSARNFKRFRGQGILFSAPHNTKINEYPRVDNWDQIRRMFLTS